jgi:hypothetical protein
LSADKKTEKKKKEAPTHDKKGLEYLTLQEFGFKRENYFFVPTERSFEKVKDHFLQQKTLGLDAEYHLGQISTITLASETTVAVFDMINLKDSEAVANYIVDIL